MGGFLQGFDNCSDMDGRNPPDKNNPTSYKDLLNVIKPCTMHPIDEDTLQPDVTKLLIPDPKNPLYGNSFTIPDYCAPNVAVYGTDFSTGYQITFIDTYCKNVTPASINNSSVQDIILKSYLPQTQPEWLSVKEASDVIGFIKKANIAPQIFSLANTGQINYTITSNAVASNISGEKPINVSDAANKDVAEAEKISQNNAKKDIAKSELVGSLGTIGTVLGVGGFTIGSTILEAAATEVAVEAGAEATEAAADDPITVGIAAVVIAAGFITDVVKEDDCYYNDAKPPTKVGGSGCCRGQCAIRGKGGSCQRNIFGYKANVFQCCLQDYYCKVQNGNALKDNNGNVVTSKNNTNALSSCYEVKDDGRTYACDPHYRGMTQPFCKEILFGYCTGQVPYAGNQSSLLQAWVPGADKIKVGNYEKSAPCLDFLARLLNDNNFCTWEDFKDSVSDLNKTDIRSENLVTAQNMLDQLLQTYIKTHGNPVTAVNSDGYIESSAFINWYFNFCQSYPLLCQDALRNNFCADYTLNDLANNPQLTNWCGCYLNEKEYASYTQFDVDINCTPTCNRPNTIPLVNDINGTKQPCTQNVCIMDDIAIRLLNTESSGNISFTQACHSCGQNSVSQITDSNTKNLNINNSSDNYTSFKIAPASDLQAELIIPQITEYPANDQSLILSPKIGQAIVPLGDTYKPASGPVNILRLDTNVSGTASFNTSKIPQDGAADEYYITGFAETPSIFINSKTKKSNIKSGTLIVITELLVSETVNKNYTYFQVIGQSNTDNNISISSSQQIGSFVSQFNLGRNTNTCRCIFKDTSISLVESQLKGANFSQNCGQTETNVNGKTVPNSISLSNSITETNNIQSSISSTENFIESIKLDKTQFIVTILAVTAFIIVVMQYLLTRYPKKYGRIIQGSMLVLIVTIGLLYFYYSYSVNWGLENDILSTLSAAF